jgi:opacity protein-like surface antigen
VRVERTGIQHSGVALTRGVRSTLALAAVVLALATPAGAQSDDTTGFTLGLGAIYIFETFDQPVDFDNSASAAILGGYRFNRVFALEFQYQFIEGFDSVPISPPPAIPPGLPDPTRLEIDGHQFTIDARIFWPKDGWRPFATVGLGAFLWNLEIVDSTFAKPFRAGSSFAVRVGGGVELPVGEHWFFSAEFSYFAPISDVIIAPFLGGVDDLDHVGIGGVVRYLF